MDVREPKSLLGFGERQTATNIFYGFRYLEVEACAGE
jgi:hypothetical protein